MSRETMRGRKTPRTVANNTTPTASAAQLPQETTPVVAPANPIPTPVVAPAATPSIPHEVHGETNTVHQTNPARPASLDKTDDVIRALDSFGKRFDAQEEAIIESVRELRDTLGVLSSNDARQRRDIDANRRDIDEMKRDIAILKGGIRAEAEAKPEAEEIPEKEEPKLATKAEAIPEKEEPKPKAEAKPERIPVSPEVAKSIPGVPNYGLTIGHVYRYTHVVDLDAGKKLCGVTADIFAAKQLDPNYEVLLGFYDKDGHIVRLLTSDEVHRYESIRK